MATAVEKRIDRQFIEYGEDLFDKSLAKTVAMVALT
jgi:hypothetical protein